MLLLPGSRLGPYEVTAAIGVRGMYEVYRATDTRRKCQVAIWVLPATVAGDAERLARFQREAEVLAALNHPHIAATYRSEKTPEFTALVMELLEGDDLSQRIARGAIPVDDVHVLVMELPEGEHLSQRLSKGAIPIDEALPIARQIAEALEAAHEQGIIHLDLKPANINVRPDGMVKVLGFGLAKLVEVIGAAPSVQRLGGVIYNWPNIIPPAMTQAGIIPGTAAYMSPEQARGKTVDKRADIWAFGAVLYEMLAGRRAFGGEDFLETLLNVLRVEPDWAALPEDVPPLVGALLRGCLVKDPRTRVADVAGIRFALA